MLPFKLINANEASEKKDTNRIDPHVGIVGPDPDPDPVRLSVPMNLIHDCLHRSKIDLKSQF